MMKTRILLSLAVVAALAACGGSFTKPSATEADFGNSVASMREAQTANPKTIANPSTEAPTGVDPDYANEVIKAMRESASRPEEVREPLVIRVGSQGQ